MKRILILTSAGAQRTRSCGVDYHGGQLCRRRLLQRAQLAPSAPSRPSPHLDPSGHAPPCPAARSFCTLAQPVFSASPLEPQVGLGAPGAVPLTAPDMKWWDPLSQLWLWAKDAEPPPCESEGG